MSNETNCGGMLEWAIADIRKKADRIYDQHRDDPDGTMSRFAASEMLRAIATEVEFAAIHDACARGAKIAKEAAECRDNCNGGNCERHDLGAEPCPGCKFCDEEGNI